MKSILFAAPRSGSGKTLITCGFLEAVRRRGYHPAAFKCGPDYIDPMFHQYVLGIPGGNLDSFFLEADQVRQVFASRLKETGADLAVIEGVMGYYDGIGAVSKRASSWEISVMTGTPSVLILDCKGASVSLAAQVKGFADFVDNSNIRGVILNRLSPMLYERLKPVIEKTGIKVYGYLPEMKECSLKSRHLGLFMPEEIEGLREKIGLLAEQIEKSLDMDGLLKLAGNEENGLSGAFFSEKLTAEGRNAKEEIQETVIAVARDEAICFYYQENLSLMERLGAKLVYFSPLRDKSLPEADGYLFGGGYPENLAAELAANTSMLLSVREAHRRKIPILAECGGFLYLHRLLEGADGRQYPMAGLIDAEGFSTDRLSRFGYITLTGTEGQQIRGHEFHYWDTTVSGGSWTAKKPMSDRSWSCMVEEEGLLAGFPHLYYPSNESWLKQWLKEASGKRRRWKETAAGNDTEMIQQHI